MREDEWQELERAHQTRIDSAVAGHLSRRGRARKHPVEDFLFVYYNYRPAQLRRWHPGTGVRLAGDAAASRADWRHYRASNGTVSVDVERFIADRGTTVDFVRGLLSATAERPGQFGCFGLHEWAMVYRMTPQERRHTEWPLRLGTSATDRFVESQQLKCTHADAFRFFTRPARELNLLTPQRETQIALEQPGCLHANMDLYKWAYKLAPAAGSDLIADCFELAREIRLMDMRASPYDLSSLGIEAVAIETAAGRNEYALAQRQFAVRAASLRRRLLEVCDRLIAG